MPDILTHIMGGGFQPGQPFPEQQKEKDFRDWQQKQLVQWTKVFTNLNNGPIQAVRGADDPALKKRAAIMKHYTTDSADLRNEFLQNYKPTPIPVIAATPQQ